MTDHVCYSATTVHEVQGTQNEHKTGLLAKLDDPGSIPDRAKQN